MAEGEHLDLERGPAAKHGLERCENGQKGRGHRRSSLAQVQEILNDDGPDQFLGRHSSRRTHQRPESTLWASAEYAAGFGLSLEAGKGP